MNPIIKEMVDAAVKEFDQISGVSPKAIDYFYSPKIKEWLRTTLTSITEKAVASERARIREEERLAIVGRIGAGLLARHAPQIVLDTYFEVANAELDEVY